MGQFYNFLIFDKNGKGVMHWNANDETVDDFVQYCATQVENGNWDLDYQVSVSGSETKLYTMEELLDEYLPVQN